MCLLENHHVMERELLSRLLGGAGKMAAQGEEAAMMSQQDRQAKMAELSQLRNKTVAGQGTNWIETFKLKTFELGKLS